MIREQTAIGKFIHGESSALMQHTQEMHAEVKCSLEIDFASDVRLGEVHMRGLP